MRSGIVITACKILQLCMRYPAAARMMYPVAQMKEANTVTNTRLDGPTNSVANNENQSKRSVSLIELFSFMRIVFTSKLMNSPCVLLLRYYPWFVMGYLRKCSAIRVL